MKEKLPICFKIALVGEAQTGKTQIMKQFVFNRFDPVYQTAFIHFEEKKFTDSKGRLFKVQIWDACGQDQTSIIPYIKTVHVIGIVVDGSRMLEASKLSKWLEQIKKTMRSPILICLMVNKTDLIIHFDEAYKNTFSQQLQGVLKENACNLVNTAIFYCSAKTGQGVEEIFYAIASCFAKTRLKEPSQCTLQQKVLPKPTFKIDKETSRSALSLTFWDKIRAALLKHQFLVASNSILILAAMVLLIVATFPAGSFIALGLPVSAVIMALIIAGISLIVWNIGYALSQRGRDDNKIAFSEPDQEEAFVDFSPLAETQETPKNISIQTMSVSNQKHRMEEAKPSFSLPMLK